MKSANSLAPVKEEKVTFSKAITGDNLQNLIKKSVATPEAAARFTGTLVSAVAASTQLQNCKPATVVAAALRGEGMGLSLGREYHLIPFKDTCAFVIGYKGLIALCLAGNDVADMDCVEVRDGEYVGRDKRTKRPVFDFSVYKTDEEAAQFPVIGYMAYCEMKNGYFRSEYMTVDEILNHAARYSKAFDIDAYKKLQSGALSPQEAERLMQGSPYYSAPETMFKKTVLRKLLNSGYIRLANSAAITKTMEYDNGIEDGGIITDLDIGGEQPIEATGDVVELDNSVPVAAEPQPVSSQQADEEKPKRGRKPRPVDITVDENEPDDESVSSFFGE